MTPEPSGPEPSPNAAAFGSPTPSYVFSETPCRICGTDAGHTAYRVREMLYGTREAFNYFQCARCGCLQITDIPEDLGLHYPEDYVPLRLSQLASSRVRRFVDPSRVRETLGDRNLIGWLANKLAKPLDYIEWARRAELTKDARILDVGCGNGRLLLRMSLGGFPNCVGVDPFVRETLRYANGVTVHKTNLDAFSVSADPFDLVMFHHALEHMSDPLKALRIAARILSPSGTVLVRVPVADSEAFEKYRENWYNIDAPRHLHILTQESMAILAGKAGLSVRYSSSGGTASQFAESEKYRRDIPGNAGLKSRDLFDGKQIKDFKRRADALNREGRGDHAFFFLKAKAAA